MTDKTAAQLIEQRRAKLDQLRQQGCAFPNDFKPNTLAKDLHKEYGDATKEELDKHQQVYHLAGRLMQKRLMGKAAFINLQDRSGRMQIYLRQNDIKNYTELADWDLGDIVGVTGGLMRTKTGELSIAANSMHLLVKALRPLPDKHKGLKAVEKRYRQRYLDLITNDQVRTIFHQRAGIIQFIRQFLVEQDFLEVETPMMQHLPGGAIAKPFKTYYNSLDADMYLRIAPELFLKQLVVGGFERVFEINRNFRNEGISTFHNPEFTMLEFYQSYADYKDLIKLTERLLSSLTSYLHHKTTISYQDHQIDMSPPFDCLTHQQALLKYNPKLNEKSLMKRQDLLGYIKQQGIESQPEWDGWDEGKLQNEIFEKTVEHQLIQPTFITHYPASVSPLARRNDEDPTLADRFELFIAGNEIANGFSELNDYDEQAKVFQQQQQGRETEFYDNDYIIALEHAMPPTAGEGIGIDRLVMLLTNQASIRDVLLFPHLKQQSISPAD